MTEVLVLCLHAISPSWTADLSVTPEALELQLSLLVRRGWRGGTFTDAVTDPPADRTLVVTFDDAFASVKRLAEPILSSFGLPATVFAPTAFMSHRQPLIWRGVDDWQATQYADELTSMDWADLAELIDRGWEIGSHTRTHPHLTQLDDATMRQELEASAEEYREHLGAPCRSIAYPFGDVDARVIEHTQRAGYVAGAASSRSLKCLGPLRWPRLGIYHTDTDRRLKLKLNPIGRRLRAYLPVS
jgi:peptidoglycan/xylan/chitin deacetylase (PgdA/CDA1 family)